MCRTSAAIRTCRRPANLRISGLRIRVSGRIAILTIGDGGTGASGTAWELVLISGSLPAPGAGGGRAAAEPSPGVGGKKAARDTGKDETAVPIVTPGRGRPAWQGLDRMRAWPAAGLAGPAGPGPAGTGLAWLGRAG